MPKHKSSDYKESAVNYYLVSDETQESVCEIFKCSPRSLMRWVDKYLEEGEIKRKNRKPVAYKVKKEHVKLILDEIKKKRTITLTELMEKLKNKFPDLKISKYHISRVIKDNDITLKLRRTRHEPTKRFGVEINVNQQIKDFYTKVNRFNLE